MQLSRIEILKRLQDILLAVTDQTGSFTEDSILATDLALSSVGLLYLVIAIEESFQIRFHNVSLGDFVRVGDVVRYIEAACQEDARKEQAR